MALSDNRYQGERLDIICRDGARYEGECDTAQNFHGRGAYRTADSRWFYDGNWEHSYPAEGAARDCNGVVWRTVYDRAPWTRESGRVPASWTRTAVTISLPQYSEGGPASEEWSGEWAYEGGQLMEGRLRGLRPMIAVEKDCRGVQSAVIYDGERTLVESLVVTSRKVLYFHSSGR